MITEDYVNFETAKLLKEKEFDERCVCYYNTESLNKFGYPVFDSIDMPLSNSDLEQSDHDYVCYSAPTLQMVMKWLREVHHYYIQVMLDSWACGGHMGYYVVIQKTDSDFEMMLSDALDEVFYKTYEETCEAAIKYCLENLI